MMSRYFARKPLGAKTILLSLALGFTGIDANFLIGLMNANPRQRTDSGSRNIAGCSCARASGLAGTWGEGL
jgi:hypothetical protein